MEVQEPELTDQRSPVAKLFSLLREERKDILFIYLYSVFVAIINLSLPLGIQGIITRVSGGMLFEGVYVLIGLVVAGVLISGILQVMQISLVEVLQRRVFARTAFEFTLTLMRLRFDALKNTHLPELMNRFFDVVTLQKGLPKLVIDLSAAMIQIFVGLLLLAFYHPLFIFLTVFLILFLYILFRITGPVGLKTSIKESTYKYKVAFWLEELARVVRPARLFDPRAIVKQTDDLVSHYLEYRQRHFRVLITQYVWIVVFKVVVIGGLLIMGVLLVVDMKISLGQFVASEFIVISLVSAVEKIIIYMDVVYDLLTGSEKLSHVTALPREPEEGQGTYKTSRTGGAEFSFDKISSVDETGRPALNDYSTKVTPGVLHVLDLHSQIIDQGTINVLIDLLSASHQSFDGVALADGVSVRDLDRRHWRGGTQLYTGASDLVAGTIALNMSLVHPKSAYTGLTQELQNLDADHLFHDLKEGMETVLLPAGGNLTAYLAEALPLAIKLAAKPRLLIVRDEVQPLQDDQKQKIVDVVSAYARRATVVVFSADPMWHKAAQVKDLTDPTLALS